MTLYPFLELEVESVPLGPNFPQFYIGEPSSGFTPGPRSASAPMTQEKNLQIVAVAVEEEEEEDPSSTCGGYIRRRRRGESGVVSNSHYNSNDNNNLGFPTTITTTT